MILKKKAKTFNDYDLSISFGQLEAIIQALERDHADPVTDELYAELQWYMQRVPGPGEEEDDVKARDEGTPGGPAQDVEGEDVPIAMPPTEGNVETGEAPPPPPGGPEGAEGLEGEPEGLESPEGDLNAGGPVGGPEEAPSEFSDEEQGELEELPEPPAA